jgi:hypothetical protein
MKIFNIRLKQTLAIASFLIVCVMVPFVSVAQEDFLTESEEFIKKEKKSHFVIGVNAGLSINNLKSSVVSDLDEWKSAPGFTLIPSLDVKYMLNQKFGLGFGFKYSTYTAGFKISIHNFELPKTYTDKDRDRYYPIFENTNIKESTTLKSIDIPFYAIYNFEVRDINCFVNVGVIYSSYNSMTYSLEGNTTRKGRYPALGNAILEDIPEYNYGELTFSSDDKFVLNGPSSAISGLISLGAFYELKSNITLKFAITRTSGFDDVRATFGQRFDSFNSSTYLSEIKLNATSIDVGIYYKLGLK